jgi:hypothetical protein
MLTQAMPALVKALTGVLPPAAVKQLTQALGNCNQPLTHRGDVQVTPSQLTTRNGLVTAPRNGGLPPSGGWSPQQYGQYMPPAGSFTPFTVYDIAGFNNYSQWNQTNYAGNQFSFPLSQEFSLNTYLGAPTFNVYGMMLTGGMFANLFGTDAGLIPLLNGLPMPFMPEYFGPTGQPFTPYPLPVVPPGPFGPNGPVAPPGTPTGPGPFNPPPPAPPGFPGPGGPSGPAGSPGGTVPTGAPGHPSGLPGYIPPGYPGGGGGYTPRGGVPFDPGYGTSFLPFNPQTVLIKEPAEANINYLDASRMTGNNVKVSVPTDAISGGTVTLSIPSNAISGGKVTLPAGIPTNAISGGKVTLNVPVNAISAGSAIVPLPQGAISKVAATYDKASSISLSGVKVDAVPAGTVVDGKVSVTLSLSTTTVPRVTAATLNAETCDISLTSEDVEVLTGVVVTQATFTPTHADPITPSLTGTATLSHTPTAATISPTTAPLLNTTVAITGNAADTELVSVELEGTSVTLTSTDATFAGTAAAAVATPYELAGKAATYKNETADISGLLAAASKQDVLVPQTKSTVLVYGP